jgi:hypothetical protein
MFPECIFTCDSILSPTGESVWHCQIDKMKGNLCGTVIPNGFKMIFIYSVNDFCYHEIKREICSECKKQLKIHKFFPKFINKKRKKKTFEDNYILIDFGDEKFYQPTKNYKSKIYIKKKNHFLYPISDIVTEEHQNDATEEYQNDVTEEHQNDVTEEHQNDVTEEHQNDVTEEHQNDVTEEHQNDVTEEHQNDVTEEHQNDVTEEHQNDVTEEHQNDVTEEHQNYMNLNEHQNIVTEEHQNKLFEKLKENAQKVKGGVRKNK